MNKSIAVLILLLSLLVSGCSGDSSYDPFNTNSYDPVKDLEKIQKEIDATKYGNQQNIKPEPPDVTGERVPPGYQPPPIPILPDPPKDYPRLPDQYPVPPIQKNSSSIETEKIEQTAYLKAMTIYIRQEYGPLETLNKLDSTKKESLRAIIMDLKRQVNSSSTFNNLELNKINYVCDLYLSKLN